MTKIELKKKTIAELKKILDKNKIEYNKTAAKDKLIELALKNIKIEISKEKKTVKKDKEPGTKKEKAANKKKTVKTSGEEKIKKNIIETAKIEKLEIKQEQQATSSTELPESYGKDKFILLIRDPLWGFVYWDISNDTRAKHNLDSADKYLRVYDITETDTYKKSNEFFDIKINNSANNWYIKFTNPNKNYIVDYGYFKDDKFVTVLRSNPGKTPRNKVSDQIDEEWMLTDEQFKLIYLASGAKDLLKHDGSQELMKFLAGNLEESLSSGGASITSPMQGYQKKRLIQEA